MGQSYVKNRIVINDEEDVTKIQDYLKSDKTKTKDKNKTNDKDRLAELPEILKGPEHDYHLLSNKYHDFNSKKMAISISKSGVKFVRIWCNIKAEPRITLAMYNNGYRRLSSHFYFGTSDQFKCWVDFEKL